MGNHICTDAVPFTLDDIATAQQELLKGAARDGSHLSISPHTASAHLTAGGPAASAAVGGGGGGAAGSTGVPDLSIPSAVVERFEGVDHNIKAFRLFYRPTAPSTGSGAGARGSGSGSGGGGSGGSPAMPPSPTSTRSLHNDPLPLPGGAARVGGRPSTVRGGYAAAVAGAGGDLTVSSSSVHVEPLALGTAVVRLRPTEVYLLVHVQRAPTVGGGGAGSPEGTPRGPAPTPPLGRQLAEDTERYGVDRSPPWVVPMAELCTPRGLAVPFASDVGRPAVASFAAASTAAGRRPSPYSSPTSADPVGGVAYSVYLFTGKRAHPLTAAVAVLHALQMERRLAECPGLARRLFFNYNVARLPAGGNVTSAVAGISQNRIHNLLVVTRAAPIGALVMDGSGESTATAGWAPYSSRGSSPSPIPGTGAPSTSPATPSLHDMYGKSALLRLLHGVRTTPQWPRVSASTTVSGPTSARFSLGSTPHSARRTPAGPYRVAPSPTTAITNPREPQLQGPPAVEITQLRTSHTTAPPRGEGVRGAIRPSPSLTTAVAGGDGGRGRGSSRSPSATPSRPGAAREGAGTAPVTRPPSSASSASAGRTLPPTDTASPRGLDEGMTPSHGSHARPHGDVHRNGGGAGGLTLGLPSMPSLRLGEVLRHRAGPQPQQSPPLATCPRAGTTAGTAPPSRPRPSKPPGSAGEEGSAGSSPPVYTAEDVETDERYMSEDRVLRLKQAAPEVTEVLPWLFVGGEEAARDRAQLLGKGITAVVNTVSFDLPNYHNDVFSYQSLCVCDAPDEPIFSLFPVVNRFIEEEKELRKGKVFVHCHQGVSRSCSFVIAYIMWRMGMCYDRAYELVRSSRKVCSPNTGFYVNLHLWEDQLVKPVFNKAYAFVPYSTAFAFPFSYRLALTFRKNAALVHDDDDAAIITPYTQVVEEGSTCVIDSRAYYGFIFGERPAASSAKAPPLYSFGYVGRHCDQTIGRRAREEWLSFLHFSFYQGPARTSVNDRGEALSFTPLAALECGSSGGGGGVASAVDTADIVRRVSRHLFSGSTRTPTFTVKEARLEKLDPLFRHDNLLFAFASRLQDEERVCTTDENRKRTREEEVRRLAHPRRSARSPRTTPAHPSDGARSSSARASSLGTLGAGGARATAAAAGRPSTIAIPTSTSTSTSTSTAAAGGAARGAATRLGTAPTALLSHPRTVAGASNGRSSAPAARTSAREPEAGLPPVTEMAVLRFPFHTGLMGCDGVEESGVGGGGLVSLEDLEPDACYAIIVPDTGAGTQGNRAFLWLGPECVLAREAVWGAFWASIGRGEPRDGGGGRRSSASDVCRRCAVQLPGHRLLPDVSAEIVLGGDEPDVLLLLM